MVKALVTGATGLFGRHIIDQLVKKGWGVRALVRPSSQIEDLERLGVEIYYGDLCNLESISVAAKGIDYLFHSGAQVGDWGSKKLFFDVNVGGTENALLAADKANVKKFIHISSLSVYGTDVDGLIINEDSPMRLTGDYYGDSKVKAEELVLGRMETGKLPVTILRPSLGYGEYDWKFIPRMVDGLKNKKMAIIGNGDHCAQLIYSGDVAACIILAAENPISIGQIYNVTNSERVTWNKFFQTLAEATNTPPPSLKIPLWLATSTGSIMETLWRISGSKNPPPLTKYVALLFGKEINCDNSKAEVQLGFKPQISWQVGLKSCTEWLKRINNLPEN